MKIFGREPAFYTGLMESILVVALSFNVWHLTTDTIGIVMAAVSAVFAVVVAYKTHDTLLSAGVGLIKALIALFVVFGLSFTQDQSVAIIAVATIVLSAWNRTQTSPLQKGSFALAA